MSDKERSAPTPQGATFQVISLDLLDNPKNPMRSDISPESVQDLVISIRQWGIIEPLVVQKVGDRFEIVAGHRRITAAGIVGLVEVPCYVISVSEEQAEFVKIHENLYRAEISPSDQAEHFSTLMKRHHLTPVKIAKLIGKSETFVSDRLQILAYPETLRAALDQKLIKFSVAKELYRIKNEIKLKELLGYATKQEIAASLARQWVDDVNRQEAASLLPAGETPAFTDESAYPETTTPCIYCATPLKLSEASIVYIHPACQEKIST